MNEVTSALLEEFKTTYVDAGWTPTVYDTTTFSAELPDTGVSIEFTEASDGFAVLRAYYDEPYDATTLTAWPDDINTTILANMHQHSLPFLYLGSVNLLTKTTASKHKLDISGGKWDEKIIENAETVLTGWELTKDTDSFSRSTLTAVNSFDDGCVITILIHGAEYKNYSKAMYTATIKEGYNADGYTNWPSDFDTYKTQYFHNHDIPAVYLGSTALDYEDYYTNKGSLAAFGAEWDSRTIDDAKKTIAKDPSWKVADTTINSEPGILVSKSFDDGCHIQFTVGKGFNSGGYYSAMVIHYEDPYTPSTSVTDWSDELKESMKNYLGSDDIEIPYVYLNSETPAMKWNSNSHTLTLTGGNPFSSGMSEAAAKAFEDANWVVTTEITISGINFCATKELETTTLVAQISANNVKKTKASMTISSTENFVVPENGAWKSDIESLMEENYNGYVLPYVYLGTMAPTARMLTSSKTLTITGGAFDDRVYTLFENALKAETVSTVKWDITTTGEDSSKKIVATATNTADSNNYTVTLSRSGSKAAINFEFDEAYVIPENGEWKTTLKSTMTSNFENHAAPFVYLGTMNPTSEYLSKYNRIVLTGGQWKNQTYTAAKSTLETQGYTVDTIAGPYGGNGIVAYKLYEEGYSFTYYLYEGEDGSTTVCQIYYGKTMAKSTSTKTDWDTETKTKIKNALGGYEVPYFTAGEKDVTIVAGSTEVTFKTNSSIWTRAYFYTLINALKKDNENWDIHHFFSSGDPKATEHYWDDYDAYFDYYAYGYGRIYGSLKQDDGSIINMCYDGSDSNGSLSFTYQDAYVNPGAYSKATQSKIESYLGGNTIPYVSLNKTDDDGEDTVTGGLMYYYSGNQSYKSYLKLSGGSFDDKIFTEAEKAFKDTNNALTWQTSYDYYLTEPILVASATTSDGRKIIVKISYETEYLLKMQKNAYMSIYYQ